MSDHHVCPVWIGYLLASPLRKLFQNPANMLAPYVREGMTVLDIGSAMGFFSIPMAKLVGPGGTVVCVDLQEKMLEVLMKRARKAGVQDRIVPHRCSAESLDLGEYAGTIDFALASAVVHESPSPNRMLRDAADALKPNGVLVVAEPSGHVTQEMFTKTMELAGQAGFSLTTRLSFPRTHTAVFTKE